RDIRPLLGKQEATVANASNVSDCDENADELPVSRPIVGHRPPARAVIVPGRGDAGRSCGGLQFTILPEMNGGRAEPLAKVEAHPQRVLNPSAVGSGAWGEWQVWPAARSGSFVEIDDQGVRPELDQRDLCGLGPSSEVGRIVDDDGARH